MRRLKVVSRTVALIVIMTMAVVFLTPAVFTAIAVPNGFGITVDFEDGTTMGFEGRDEQGIEVLTVTDEISHSGTYSLLTTNRTKAWHGPSLNVAEFVQAGAQYTISIMVHAKTPDVSQFRLSTQVGQGANASYNNLEIKNISVSDGWVEMTGTFTYPAEEYITIYVENDELNAEFYIDDVSFITEEGVVFSHDASLPSLAGIYRDYFLIGTAISRADVSGPRFELVKHHFNLITVGNEMKPDALTTAEKGTFNFERADAILASSEDAGISIHGHTLVWHSQSRDWLNKKANGDFLTRNEARANMEEFINTVAGHYAGRVISWDVVNEAFQTSVGSFSDWKDVLRKGGTTNEHSAWYGAYTNGANEAAGESGADYIYDAFVFTRLADPNAVLYYNDFNETDKNKRNAIAEMTEELNEQWKNDPRNTVPDRLLIEGLGMQAHYWTDNLNVDDVEDTIIRWISTGAEIGITELDIPMGRYNAYKEATEDELLKQANFYAELFLLFKKYSENISRVTIWGIDDATSWRSGGSPLLFEYDGTEKLAFFAVMDPQGFIDGLYFDNGPVPDDEANPDIEPHPMPAPEPIVPEAPAPTEPPVDNNVPASNSNTWMIILIAIGSAVIIGSGVIISVFLIRERNEKK